MIELSTEFLLHSTQGTIISGLCHVKLFINRHISNVTV